MKKFVLALVLTFCVASLASAGWEHMNKAGSVTYWTDRPTPATAWLRYYGTGVLWPALKIQVFDSTIHNYDYTREGTSTNHPVSLGYWVQDSAGILFPDSELSAVATDEYRTQGNWADVEWIIDTSGILWPKL